MDRPLGVKINHSGSFREQIPLLVGVGDKLDLGPGKLALMRGARTFLITFDPEIQVVKIETDLKVGPRKVVAINLPARNSLTYRIAFELNVRVAK